jgi:hypothetical protein
VPIVLTGMEDKIHIGCFTSQQCRHRLLYGKHRSKVDSLANSADRYKNPHRLPTCQQLTGKADIVHIGRLPCFMCSTADTYNKIFHIDFSPAADIVNIFHVREKKRLRESGGHTAVVAGAGGVHRVGRVLSVSPIVGIGTPPPL